MYVQCTYCICTNKTLFESGLVVQTVMSATESLEQRMAETPGRPLAISASEFVSATWPIIPEDCFLKPKWKSFRWTNSSAHTWKRDSDGPKMNTKFLSYPGHMPTSTELPQLCRIPNCSCETTTKIALFHSSSWRYCLSVAVWRNKHLAYFI
jgi:hypothetical protein